MRTHRPIHCEACRVILLVPALGRVTLPLSWIVEGHEATDRRWFYCSEECRQKGRPTPVRPAIMAFLDFDRDKTEEFKLGAEDALNGFDCIGSRSDYVKGHAAGMKLRQSIEGMQNEIARKTD